jgi:hypothetical protein
LLEVAQAEAKSKILVPTSITSREADRAARIPSLAVGGRVLREKLPWAYSFYTGLFRDLAQSISQEPVAVAQDDRYGAVLNIQKGINMRYECHVDSNPLEGLLYVTDHPKGTGGELVVANDPVAASVAEVDADCSVIYPVAGNLIFFDARDRAHYVRSLTTPNYLRVVLAMNFYLPSCPESARPADLNRHLFGQE